MTDEEYAASLSRYASTEEILDSLPPASPSLIRTLRDGFVEGDELGNGNRLIALVGLDREGTLDVLRNVLEDTVEVGGIYSNLRNTALELMRDHYRGHPALAAPLWRAIEIDEYLSFDVLYPVVAAYDASRASALLATNIENGVPTAIEIAASDPTLLHLITGPLDSALAGDDPGAFIELLGDAARAPDLMARIAPHADRVPAAAELVMKDDPVRLRSVADQLGSKDARWRAAAIRALQELPAEEAFTRASAVFTAADRTKPAGRERIEAVVWALPSLTTPLDPRWFDFLTARLTDETDAKVRGLLVTAFGAFGPPAVSVILGAAQSDKDKDVLAALPDALAAIGPDDGVLEQVRAAAEGAKGKRKQALEQALELFES